MIVYLFVVLTVPDDGIEIPIPVMLDGEVSIIEFIDLPYNGVSYSALEVQLHY